MVKNIYEILDEFNKTTNKQERLNILKVYATHPAFKRVLEYAYSPNVDFYVKSFPKNYKEPDQIPGLNRSRYVGIEAELRRVYLFVKGNPTADKLTEEKRNILLLQLLESFELREAQVFIDMMKKDLGVKHLTPALIREAYSDVLI